MQDILAQLASIHDLENLSNTPINPPTKSLVARYMEKCAHNFESKSIGEFGKSTDDQTIVCMPDEALSPADLVTFERYAKEMEIERKSAVISGNQPTSSARLAAFLKDVSAEENSNIPLERIFIFTDMNLRNPSSIFSDFGVHLTDGTAYPIKMERSTKTSQIHK